MCTDERFAMSLERCSAELTRIDGMFFVVVLTGQMQPSDKLSEEKHQQVTTAFNNNRTTTIALAHAKKREANAAERHYIAVN
jgi:hypothetical protein